MCVILCLFSTLNRRVGALQISIIIIIIVVVVIFVVTIDIVDDVDACLQTEPFSECFVVLKAD